MKNVTGVTFLRSRGGKLDGLSHQEACVVWNVATDEGGQGAGLYFEHAGVSHRVAVDWVSNLGGLSLLVAAEELGSTLFVELTGVAPHEEVVRGDGAVVDECKDDGVGDDGAELLHEIEGQRGSTVAASVVEACVGIEADSAESGEAIFDEQSVGKGEQGVNGVAWWSAIAVLELKASAWRQGFEEPIELAKVEGGSLAFIAEQRFDRSGDFDLGDEIEHGLGSVFVAASGFGLRAKRAHQQCALVAYLGFHDGASQAESDV